MRRRPISARTRLTWFTAALVVVMSSLAIVAVTLAMGLLPNYQFVTSVTPVDTSGPLVTGPPVSTVTTPVPMGAVSIADTGTLVRSMVFFGVIALILVAVAAIWLSWTIAGLTMRPLTLIAEAARRAATGNLDHRIDLQHGDREFRELAAA